MADNYDKILERISKISGLGKDEIERRIEAKRARLSGLISREGAAQVVVAELGISFDNEKLKIDELLPGMKKVQVVGKVIRLFPVREFTTKKGDKGKVANLILADDTANVKVVLWDTNHIDLIENGLVKETSVIEILNGSIRDEEIHLGSFSELKLSSEVLENVQTEKTAKTKTIKDFKVGDSVNVRAFIVQSFEPKFFNVCSECKKKVTDDGGVYTCAEHGSVAPERRALINIVIDDGTESTRTVLFHDNLALLGLTNLADPETLLIQRNGILGKEMIFSGNIRMNKFFNTPEFIVDGVQEVNLDNLIAELEE